MERKRRTSNTVGFQENKVKVKYSFGDSLVVEAEMTQIKLSELLMNKEVFLISVNEKKTPYRRKKY